MAGGADGIKTGAIVEAISVKATKAAIREVQAGGGTGQIRVSATGFQNCG